MSEENPLSVEITPNTRFIEVVSGDYPLSFWDIRQRFNNISFPSEPTYEQFASIGCYAVLETTPPTGDVVFELAPFLRQDGYYEQVWDSRPFTPEELAQYITDQKMIRTNNVAMLQMIAVNNGAVVDFGALGGEKTISLSDSNRLNVLSLRLRANSMIAGNSSTGPLKVRTVDNVSISLTPQQAIDFSWLMLNAYDNICTTAWELQDLIAAATTIAEMPTMPQSLSPPIGIL